jgi:hypothetical protein
MISRRVVIFVVLSLVQTIIFAQITPWEAIEQMQKGINLEESGTRNFNPGTRNPEL